MTTQTSVWGRAAIVSLAAAFLSSAQGAGFNAHSYVQDGLIAQFDAIDNTGTGTHDASATVWKDLKGSASITLPSGVKWIDRALDAGNVALTAANMPEFYLDSVATDIALNALSHGTDYPRIIHHHKSDGWYSLHFNPNSTNLQFYIGDKGSPRPLVVFTSGTLSVASDTTNYRMCIDGAGMSTSGTTVQSHTNAAAGKWTINRGDMVAYYRALRHYNRALTQTELDLNVRIDKIRLFSYSLKGTDPAKTLTWATAGWKVPYGSSTACPATTTNDFVRIIAAKVAVAADDGVAVKCISLEDGASLAVAADVDVGTILLYVEGQNLPRGVYTGPEGTYGTKVNWISGAGQVRVAGEGATRFPPRATAGLGASSYVQDGLVAQFDAIDNVGTGSHDATAAAWFDLAGTASLTLTTNTTWREGRYFEKGGDGKPVYYGKMPAYKRDSLTFDVPINIHASSALTDVGNYPRIFAHGESFSVYFVGSGTDAVVYIASQKPDTRPNLGKFRIGTIAAFSGADNYGGAVDGAIKSKTSVPARLNLTGYADTWSFGYAGKMLATYGGLRFYNRCLTEDELKHNTLVDKFRYFSYRYVNTNDEAIAWAEIPWSVPEGQTAASPGALTNQYVTIVGGTVSVAATDTIALKGLSLENGAKLKFAAGGTIEAKVVYINGKTLTHGIYTAAGEGLETAVDWIEGAGRVCVAGGLDRGIPTIIPTADEGGWFTFGLEGGSTPKQLVFVGEHPIWDSYVFPVGAKLRLKGHILLDTVPNIFDDYDTTQLKCAYVNGTRAYAAERPFIVPDAATFRFFPGTWTAGSDNTHTAAYGGNESLMKKASGDVVLGKGSSFTVSGDGMPNLTYSGRLSGDGNLAFGSYGRQMRLTGGVAVNGSGTENWQNGCGVWFDTIAMTSSLQTVWLCACNDKWGTNATYSASFLAFGMDGSDATADHPLSVATLNGNASSRLDVPSGHRWRSGGHLLVWGSNTVHIGTLNKGLHVVARQADQDCKNGFLHSGYYKSKGIGFVEIENFASGTIFGSTNVALTVGTVASGTTFDYTYQANAVNRLTLDITGNCAENATVMATDLAMLPARVSGFKGQVKLTDTAAKNYEMPIDLSAGPQGLYNTVGCDGSGTLVAAPETSAINVTFPTEGVEPVPGKYAIARFSAGGELLDGWSVTLNGETVRETRVGNHLIALRRTAKGIYLGVDLPGMRVILK